MKVSLDKVIEKIVALGVPGLVLVIVIATTGLAGGAAIVAALATLGGPFGMLGGLAVLGLLVLISDAIAEYGAVAVANRVVEGLIKKGMTKEEIIRKIDSYWWVSDNLKGKLKEYVRNYPPNKDSGTEN